VTGNPNVTITYRTADPNGVPLLPSLMVPEHDPAIEIPRTQYVWDEPFSALHTRRTAVKVFAQAKAADARARRHVPELSPLRHAILGAYAESQRREGRDGRPAGSLGPWNGHLRDSWVQRYMQERFGEERIWSASQLELYAQCPFVYFVQRVLWLDELAEAEEETTALTFGGVAHDLLEQFYGEFAGPFPADLTGSVEQLYHSVADRVFTDVAASGGMWLGLSPLWQLTREEIRTRVAEYLAWELPRFKRRRPRHRELGFGQEGKSPLQIAGNDLSGTPMCLRLRGRVDRVDVSEGRDGEVHHVVDYKTGSTPSPSGYLDGATLQTPLYMAATAAHLGVT
jgi:ATP-dependent helicase/DNAse subunit B